MPYAVYHGNHVWGLGLTPNSAMTDARTCIQQFNVDPEGHNACYRKNVNGMWLLYVDRNTFEKISVNGGENAARKFKLIEKKKERMYKEFV